jgi:hypothetical protein
MSESHPIKVTSTGQPPVHVVEVNDGKTRHEGGVARDHDERRALRQLLDDPLRFVEIDKKRERARHERWANQGRDYFRRLHAVIPPFVSAACPIGPLAPRHNRIAEREPISIHAIPNLGRRSHGAGRHCGERRSGAIQNL